MAGWGTGVVRQVGWGVIMIRTWPGANQVSGSRVLRVIMMASGSKVQELYWYGAPSI